MELESRYGVSGGDPILDASTADPHSHQRFLRAGTVALVALGALSIPIRASATTTVFATVPAESITAAPAGFSGKYLVADGMSGVYSIGARGGTPTLLAHTNFIPYAGATLGSYYGGLSGQYLEAGINGNVDALAANGTQIDAITASSFKPTGTVAAPEIDPASAAGALTLLLGSLAVLRGRRALD